MRSAGLLDSLRAAGLEVEDCGNMPVPMAERKPGLDPGPELVAAVEAFCRELRDRVAATHAVGDAKTLVLGGEHSLGAGSQAGVSLGRGRRGLRPAGLIWFDAHADCNTPETTPSGNLHGMPLAALLGLDVPAFRAVTPAGCRLDPSTVCLVGQRDVDPGERVHLERLGVRMFERSEIDRRGIAAVMAEAIARASRDGAMSFSLDLDSLDPSIAPGVDCPTPGGIRREELFEALRLAAAAPLVHVEVVEVNPTADPDGITARIAVEAARMLLSGS
jgi:arginase